MTGFCSTMVFLADENWVWVGGKFWALCRPAEALAELESVQTSAKKGPQQSPDFCYLKNGCKGQATQILGTLWSLQEKHKVK